jgi:putative sugar O-methyltransferase
MDYKVPIARLKQFAKRRMSRYLPKAVRPSTGGRDLKRSAPTKALPSEWDELTRRMLQEMEQCDAIYRPTNFWGPGVEELLSDMRSKGIDRFKSWPTASFWFYPIYGRGFTKTAIDATFDAALAVNPKATRRQITSALTGLSDAQRDFDAARLFWDQRNWPADIETLGESRVGRPPQYHRVSKSENGGWGRPYLNYLLCMSALSRHVQQPPKSFVEIGGGFGVLGEIVMSRDPEARYVNFDIPPLLTVASYYLTELFGRDRVIVYDQSIPQSGPLKIDRSACLPNWRVQDLTGNYDVFVNSFSFQEMEPHVVEHYIASVAAMGVRYVVSLNSRKGKPIASNEQKIGVVEQVTSEMIASMFAKHGFEIAGRYGDPLIRSAGELIVLQRS